jgi:uncharacterized protein (DUF305 family)
MTTHARHHPPVAHAEHHDHGDSHASTSKPYVMLAVSTGIGFVVMYAIMFAMVDRWANVYANLSNVYMTGLMAVTMVPIMLATMPGMFKNRRWNVALWIGSAGALASFWGLLRTEAGVHDGQFTRAMISHHAAAIQMCSESSLSDPRVRDLCARIVTSQEAEIAEMKGWLRDLD